jgi:hypothetical protein
MTLLATEIVTGPPPAIVFAADRRISLGGRRHTERRKILPVPRKRAGIGYFGLAELPLSGRQRHMDVWLADFLQANSLRATLGELANRLAEKLNRIVPAATYRAHVSGFHLAGFDQSAQPEFWFVRNIDDDRVTMLGQFAAREEFQRRDRPLLPPGAVQIYRNGDIRAHAAVWEDIDRSFGALLHAPDFHVGVGPVAYARWVKFKLETIAHFYQRFSRTSIIGKPIDAFVVTLGGVRYADGTRP